MRKSIIVAILSLVIVAGVVWAANGPYPSVGLYWLQSSDPTAGGGVSAPLNQLLIRTDHPSLYYKSGNPNTAWTPIGQGASSGGTVTSIACGTSMSCAPSPITTTGTISLNIPPTTCPAGEAEITTASDGSSTCAAEGAGSVTITPMLTGIEYDNWAPTGYATANLILANATVGLNTITGLAGGVPGRRVTLINDGTQNIALWEEEAASSPANRFQTDLSGGYGFLVPGEMVQLVYDGVTSRWQIGWMFSFNSPTSLNVNGQLEVASTATVIGEMSVCADGVPGCSIGEAAFTFTPGGVGGGGAILTSNDPAAPTDNNILLTTHYYANARTTEALTQYAQITGTFDTTAAPGFDAVIEADSTATRSAGANPLVNMGFNSSVTGGDTNIAYNAVHGTMNAPDGASFGPTLVSTLLTADAITESGAGTDTLTWTGTVTLGTVGPVQIGTNASNVIALNSTITTLVAMSNALTDNTLSIASVAAGGHKYKLNSSGTAGYWGSGAFTIADDGGCAGFGCNLMQWDVADDATRVGFDLIVGATTQSGSPVIKAGHVRALGIAATVACDGTGSPSITGDDFAGKITSGTGSTTCTVTFNGETYISPPACTITPEASLATPPWAIPATTSLAIHFAISSALIVDYTCIGLV